jgi:hypothetical protein
VQKCLSACSLSVALVACGTSAEFNMKKIDGIQNCAYYIPQAYIHEADEKRNVAYIV